MAKGNALSAVEVRHSLDLALGSHEGVVYTDHLRSRSYDRQFDIFDLRHVLERGCACGNSWSAEYQSWTYKVVGTDLEGECLTVVVAIDPGGSRVTVVTAYG